MDNHNYSPGCYAKGDRMPEYQPDATHPLIVDLLAPDFNDLDTITMIRI